jgi:biotin carboxyl carrier protein
MSIDVRTEVAGSVFEILVAVGDSVEADETVALVESMKMEVPVIASQPGTVRAISVSEGDSVDTGAVILTVG